MLELNTLSLEKMARHSNERTWKYWFKQPIIWLFGHKKSVGNFNFSAVDSILIRPTGKALGDAVINSSCVRQLKTMYPHARIGVLVAGSNRAVFECCPQADELVDEKTGEMWKQRGRWQVLLDMPDAFNTGTLIGDKLLSPQMTMIFHKKHKPYFNTDNIRNYDFHCPPPESACIAEFLQCSEFAKHFPITPEAPCLNIPDSAKQQAQQHWQNGKIRLLLCPQGSQRQLPEQELADLLNGIPADLCSRIDFMLGNTAGSGTYLNKLQSLCNQSIIIRLAPASTLSEYIALVDSCDIVVGVDSGSIHVGCATAKPVLGFYANHEGNLNRWRLMPQSGVPHLTVVSRRKCASANDTFDFPLEEAGIWLNKQIRKCGNC